MAGTLEQKVVAVTGASSGIGASTARLLARSGARLVLGARREDRLAELAEELRGAGAEVAYRAVDVRRRTDLAALVELAGSRFGRLDVLIGNAGIGPISELDELRVDDWDAMVDINLKGLMYGVAAALPVFRRQGRGQFVHTVSTAAYKTVPGQVVYSATKAAARTFTEGLRQEAGPSIRVTIVSPGFVGTDFLESVPDADLRRKMLEMRDRIALTPDAVARAISFAVEQPDEVDINEIVLRPTAQA
ncbi:SDR family oxidoreductase [Streptomyces sp. NBC_01190]|uniref:SDR family oxidoreductase n=1 Tax=Streptomyces sp. NBC_01190 TaxID=2903767 RepID=UPI003867E96E|nr:SDR family oxidoreductase [Streptomyces sp. NBC_01190]